MRLARLAILVLLTGAIPAQQNPDDLHEHLELLRQKKQSRQDDEQQLLDLLVRHHMGFDVHLDRWGMLPVEEQVLPVDQAQERLLKEEAEVARLADRLERLSAELDRNPRFLAQQLADGAREPLAVDPTPSMPLFEPAPVRSDPVLPEPDAPERETRVPELPEGDARRVALENSSSATLIVGTRNRSAIAGSLSNVGASLMRDAKELREWGRGDEARELDDQARRRLELALLELEPLIAAEEPAYVDLFHQGKCLEGLLYLDVLYGDLQGSGGSTEYAQRFEAMRQPYLAISARDVGEDGKTLGAWGRAAQSALRVIRWMNDFGDYQPAIPIDSIQWNRK